MNKPSFPTDASAFAMGQAEPPQEQVFIRGYGSSDARGVTVEGMTEHIVTTGASWSNGAPPPSLPPGYRMPTPAQIMALSAHPGASIGLTEADASSFADLSA